MLFHRKQGLTPGTVLKLPQTSHPDHLLLPHGRCRAQALLSRQYSRGWLLLRWCCCGKTEDPEVFCQDRIQCCPQANIRQSNTSATVCLNARIEGQGHQRQEAWAAGWSRCVITEAASREPTLRRETRNFMPQDLLPARPGVTRIPRLKEKPDHGSSFC